ncbi:MAG: hypothetical protein K2K60_04680 [Clostridia bacterium]|nr:hypothetical protein [Clostridia bacterium]
MKKLVLKSALFAVAALAIAALLTFSLWILCSPQSMATASERAGNYSFAVTCADLRFKYTKDTSDLARCAEDAILSGKDKHILNYGKKLIARTDFDEVCNAKNEKLSQSQYGKYTADYKSYICGNVAAAEYRGGDLQTAIKTAGKANSETAFIKLTLEVAKKGTDKEKKELKTAIENKYPDLANIL